MDSSQRLTIASTWSFDPEGAEYVRQYIKSMPQGLDVFSRYEANHDVFNIEDCGIFRAIPVLATFMADFIDREKANNLLEKWKIARIDIPAYVDEELIEDTSELDGPLIETLPAPQPTNLPMTLRYWQDNKQGIDSFVKAPSSLFTHLHDATGAFVALETTNKRIRVMSSEASQANLALKNLDNLQKALHLIASPQFESILYVGNAQEYHIRLCPYAALNDVALRRVLPAETSPRLISQLSKTFVTVMELCDPKTSAFRMPKNMIKPPRLPEQRKAGSRLWANVKFTQLGDPANIPELGTFIKGEVLTASSSSIKSDARETAGLGTTHSWLTSDKIPAVEKWVSEGLEAGAVGLNGLEPNKTLPPEPSAEDAAASKPIIKKRRAFHLGEIKSESPTDNKGKGKERAPMEPSEIQTRPKVPAAGDFIFQSQNPTQLSNFRRATTARTKARNERRIPDLIDFSAAATSSEPPELQPMDYFQEPLVPLRPSLVPLQPSSQANLCLEHIAESLPSKHNEPINQDNTCEEANEKRLDNLKRSLHSISTTNRPASARIADKGDGIREFHRTMRQKAPTVPTKKEQKVLQKAKRDAALAEAWGIPKSTPSSSSKPEPANKQEPSLLEKQQLQRREEINVQSIKDLFNAMSPILEAARHFTGSLTLQFEIGLILTYTVPKLDVDRAIDTKRWNQLYRPGHGLPGLTTIFTNKLTTSGADIDHILDLNNKDGMNFSGFSSTPSIQAVCYEFHCQTKDDEMVVVSIDELGTTTINRPEVVLGAANVHFPQNIWDMRAVMKGTQEYRTETGTGVDRAIKSLLDNLYVEPNRARALLYSRILADELRITKVILRRSTRHLCIEDGTWEVVPNDVMSQDEVTKSGNPSVYLQITEIQDLFLSYALHQKSVIRARALEPEAMINNSRLWYEVSLVSPAIRETLESNRDLAIGECTDAWHPADLLGFESHLAASPATAAADILNQKASVIGPSGIGKLFRITKDVVENIDVVGWSNQGPAAVNPLNKAPSNLCRATSRVTESGELAQETASVLGRFMKTPRGVFSEGEFW
ncbi:hypothetical protein FQN57_005473 [Myotisia sp. PD_48]|nr:hypothetical protein FQN57_005473 [Myotisia sp. PD_48]